MISNYIKTLGFKENINGTRLIIEMLEYHFMKGTILPLSKNGYKIMSAKYNKTVSAVIKEIQYSIDSAFLEGNVSLLFDIFGSTIDENTGRPSSKQFIMTLIDKIQNGTHIFEEENKLSSVN